MKRITIFKILLDVIMAVTFALLFNKFAVTGLAFHEIAGLAIGAAFIVHQIINWKWIKQITLNLFNNKISFKTKLGYIIDFLLLISMAYIIISGILVSKILFPNIKINNQLFFTITHIAVSYLTLIFLGIHIGLHWTWVISIFNKIFKPAKANKIFIYISRVLVILIFIFSIYTIYSKDFIPKLSRLGIFVGIEQPSERPNYNHSNNGSSISNGNNSQNFSAESNNNNSYRRNDNRNSLVESNNNNLSEDTNIKNSSGEKRVHSFDKSNIPKVNIFDLIVSILVILSFFAIITYYLEKLFSKIFKKK
jgi:hypothetical protein